MVNILVLLSSMSLSEFESINQLSKIIKGIYSISTGGITQKNISRQTEEEGYGYRSVQRFFALDINWELLYLSCIMHCSLKGVNPTIYCLSHIEIRVKLNLVSHCSVFENVPNFREPTFKRCPRKPCPKTNIWRDA